MFKRKAYSSLKAWKEESAGATAILIEGARRVGKSTVALEFAKAEYEEHLLIDFSTAEQAVRDNFENIGNMDAFFRNLFILTGKTLKERRSVIIFDEVQFFPKARQAIKHLVKDGRFDFIETGSLISIKKNVQDILIPSEEECLTMHPLDFEEFLWAVGNHAAVEAIRDAFVQRKPLGSEIHRKIMQVLRTYMAVGGMPQAVESFVAGKNYLEIDRVKKGILRLYVNDLRKHGGEDKDRAVAVFKSLPAQLMNRNSVFKLSAIEDRARTRNYGGAIDFLQEAMLVNSCVNVTNPEVALAMYADRSRFKLFMADTGLLVSSILDNGGDTDQMYRSLIIDKLGINQGMIFENLVAQMLRAHGHELYYHAFKHCPEGNAVSKQYEVDFLTVRDRRLCPIEVKSSGYKSHKSFDYFREKYHQLKMNERFIVYTRDLAFEDGILYMPVYMAGLI